MTTSGWQRANQTARLLGAAGVQPTGPRLVRGHGPAAVAYVVDQTRADPHLLDRLQALLGGQPDQTEP